MTYQHKAAFALMWYACEGKQRSVAGAPSERTGCGHRELIWNSRDGVTPFGCACPSCGKTMLHVDWERDVRVPDYKPRPGQGFWRDGTPDEAEAIIRKRVEQWKDEYPIPTATLEALIKASREGKEGEFRTGWPTLERA